MAEYGFVTYTQDGVEGFNLSTRITKKVLDVVVGANDSGTLNFNIPDNLHVAITVVQLDGDANMRHFPHNVTFNVGSRSVSYSPSVNHDSRLDRFPAWSRPARSRSAIIIYAFVPG